MSEYVNVAGTYDGNSENCKFSGVVHYRLVDAIAEFDKEELGKYPWSRIEVSDDVCKYSIQRTDVKADISADERFLDMWEAYSKLYFTIFPDNMAMPLNNQAVRDEVTKHMTELKEGQGTYVERCVHAFSKGVNKDEFDVEQFVHLVTQVEHRTLQQLMFKRMWACIVEWAKCNHAGRYDARNAATVLLCKKIVEAVGHEQYFPFI